MTCLFQVLFFVIIEHNLGVLSRFVPNLFVVAGVRVVLKMFLFWAENRDLLFLYSCSYKQKACIIMNSDKTRFKYFVWQYVRQHTCTRERPSNVIPLVFWYII